MPDESNEPTNAGFDPGACPWQQLLHAIALNWPPSRWKDVGVVVGCSGGADSVAMLVALSQLRQTDEPPPRGFLVAAHFNHGLRGEQSDADQQLVEDLAHEHGLRCVIGRGRPGIRDEAGMRDQRIEFLTETARASGARYVAVAHSADDNIETVLHHLLRGTGPSGLAGIRPHRSLDNDLVLIRPLLEVRRQPIRDALQAIGQRWREDASNEDPEYRRNWIRHDVMPMLRDPFPQVDEAILRAIDGQRQWADVIHALADQWIESQPRPSGSVVLRCDPAAPQAVVVLALQKIWDRNGWPRQPMAQTHWRRLAHCIHSAQSDRFTLPGEIDVTVDVTVDGSSVTITR